jgi:hypothetical protein
LQVARMAPDLAARMAVVLEQPPAEEEVHFSLWERLLTRPASGPTTASSVFEEARAGDVGAIRRRVERHEDMGLCDSAPPPPVWF